MVLDTDQDNLFVTMTINTIYPDIFLLSRCAREHNQEKLARAGANKVINPYVSGGHRMAEILIKPQVEDFNLVVSPKNSKMNLTIDEISLDGVQKYDEVIQLKIQELEINLVYRLSALWTMKEIQRLILI